MKSRIPVYRNRLEGKIAIVTGAGSQGAGDGVGTGKAIAVVFAGEGAKLCLVDRDPARAEDTLAQITEAGGEAFVAIGDVTRSADCARFVDETVERYGGLDILVNNVGVAGALARLENLDEEAWSQTLAINLKSAVLMSKYAIPPMISKGAGAIVNIASIAGLQGYGSSVDYGPSKAAMAQLSREIAVMYGRQGIRANTVAPGHIFTPLTASLFDETVRTVRRKASPLGVEGDAWDVAAATLFLASDEARFVSGALLPVDGGVSETGVLAGHALINDF